jgi:acyl-CoA reductase-like NAD-dependent aldehyde dehydrogenase
MSEPAGRAPQPVDAKVLIGGEWYQKDDRLESLNPATGEIIGYAPLCNREDVGLAVRVAREAQPSWAALPLDRRIGHVETLRGLVAQEGDALASLITQESGKPLQEAHFLEILGTLDLMGGLCKGAPAYLGDRRARSGNSLLWGKRYWLRRVPLGVLGVISPGNLPLVSPMGQILPALLAGNTVVFKPSEFASLVGTKLAGLFHRAGFPPGVLNLVTGGCETGAYLVEGGLDGLLFAGSMEAGVQIQARLAPRPIPTELALRGEETFLVLPDAPFGRTVNGAAWAACSGTGQACARAKRFLVPAHMRDRFAAAVAAKVGALRVGNGMEEGVEVGPLISSQRLERVEAHVQEAISRGARLLCGGRRLPAPGFFFQPTVLVDVPPDCALMREETFGPVVPVAGYTDPDEAVRWINDSSYGLSASIWTADVERALALGRRLAVGSVWINDVSCPHTQAWFPWGERKQSGSGRTHPLASLREWTSIQLLSAGGGQCEEELWWFPYSPDGLDLARRMRFLLAEGLAGRLINLVPFLKDLVKVRGTH